jgi:hypothetical protein
MNEQDKDIPGGQTASRGPVESMGSAPAPEQSMGSAPAPEQSFGSAPGADEQFGEAPKPEDTFGDAPAPKRAGGPNVPLLVGGAIALLAALAAILGLVVR